MKHHIKTGKSQNVEINIEASEEERSKVLSSLQDCQSGQCGCPSEEYSKIENIELVTDDKGINISLKPKPDAVIDITEVEKCLSWTKEQVKQK